MAETRERDERGRTREQAVVGPLDEDLDPDLTHRYYHDPAFYAAVHMLSKAEDHDDVVRILARLATLSTPREPEVGENLGDEIRGALRLTDKLRRWIIKNVGVESGIDAIDLTSHLRAHLDSAACIVLYSDRSPPYTDEDGREGDGDE